MEEGEGQGQEERRSERGWYGEGVSRFARIWGRILNAYNSVAVRARSPNMVHFSTKSGTRYRLEQVWRR